MPYTSFTGARRFTQLMPTLDSTAGLVLSLEVYSALLKLFTEL